MSFRNKSLTTSNRWNRLEQLERREMLNADPGWLMTFDNATVSQKGDVAIDSLGNVAAVVQLSSAADLDPGPGVDLEQGVVVANYSSTGTLNWAHNLGGAGMSTLAFDPLGGVVVAGSFTGIVDFDPGVGVTELDSANGSLYVARLASDGTFDWVAQSGGRFNEYGGALDVDLDGNIFIGGRFSQSATFGETTLTSDSSAAFVAKLDATGNFLWANAQEDAYVWSLTVDDASANSSDWSVYLASRFGLIRSLDTQGNTRWSYVTTGESGPQAEFYDVTVGSNGHAYAIGTFSNAVDFDPTAQEHVLLADRRGDAVIVDLTHSGVFSDAISLGSPGSFGSGFIAADGQGSVYVTGEYSSRLIFAGGTIVEGDGSGDTFLAEFDEALAVHEAYTIGGTNLDNAGMISASSGGVAYVGDFQQTARFSTGEVVTVQDGVWLQRINPSMGTISGRLFADFNSDGLKNDQASFPVEAVVYLDANGDGQRDASEPWTQTVGTNGEYSFGNLAAGSYVVRYEDIGAWTPTTADSASVSLAAGESASAIDFGLWHPHETTRVHGSPFDIRTKSSSTITGYVNVSGVNGTVVDVNVNVDVDFPDLSELQLSFGRVEDGSVPVTTLMAYDEAQGTALDNVTFDQDADLAIFEASGPYSGSYRDSGGYYSTSLRSIDGIEADGEWYLRAEQLFTKLRGTVNSWSIDFTHLVEPEPPSAPTIDSLSASPDPVLQGDLISLTADNVADANNDLAQVAFYRDNGDGAFDAALDELVAVDTDGADGWSASAATAGLPLGEQLYFAQAKDFTDLVSSAASASVTVVDEVSGSANDVYVWGIDFETKTKGKNKDLRIVIDLNRDGNADGIAAENDIGANNIQVTVQLYDSNGNPVGDPIIGTTDENGIFTSNWIRGLDSGLYTAEVQSLDLALAGWTWNHDLDNEDDTDGDGLPDDVFLFV